MEGKTEFFTNTYTYDNRGQLISVSTLKEGKTSELRYTYDKAGRATAGAMPTAAAVAPAIPGAFEGLWALLAALGGALAGAVGGAIPPVVLVGVAVVGTTVLGLETYKHLTAEKGAVTPTIAEKILEAAREKEEEPIKVSPDDSDLYDGNGNLKQEGGGRIDQIR